MCRPVLRTVPRRSAPRKLPIAELSPDDLQAIFGQNLKIARFKRGLTLMEVAEAAGVSNQHVSDVEHGRKNVTLATMKKFAKVVDHDVSGMIQLAQHDELPPAPTSKNKGD